MLLSQFNFVIIYCPNNLQGKPNALLQQSYLVPKEGDSILDQQKSIVLKPPNFQLKASTMSSCDNASYLKKVQKAFQNDPFVANIREHLYINDINDESEFKDGLLYFKELLYILLGPTRLKIIQIHYDLLVAVFLGFNKTMELISRE